MGVGSLFPWCGSEKSNSGRQAWEQVLTESLVSPIFVLHKGLSFPCEGAWPFLKRPYRRMRLRRCLRTKTVELGVKQGGGRWGWRAHLAGRKPGLSPQDHKNTAKPLGALEWVHFLSFLRRFVCLFVLRGWKYYNYSWTPQNSHGLKPWVWLGSTVFPPHPCFRVPRANKICGRSTPSI